MVESDLVGGVGLHTHVDVNASTDLGPARHHDRGDDHDVDANANVTTVIRTTPNKLGSFIVQCSQLCGLYHAFMNNKAAVFYEQDKIDECIKTCEQGIEIGRENKADYALIAK